MPSFNGCHFEYEDSSSMLVSSRDYKLVFANVNTSPLLQTEGTISGATIYAKKARKRYLIDDDFSESPLTFDAEIVTEDGSILTASQKRAIEKWLFNRSGYRKLYKDHIDDTNSKNLIIIKHALRSLTGVTTSVNSGGVISLSGTATSDTEISNADDEDNKLKFSRAEDRKKMIHLPAGTYCLSGGISSNIFTYLVGFFDDGTEITRVNDTGSGAVYTFDSDVYVYYSAKIKNGTNTDGVTIRPQVEYGGQKTSYTAYSGEMTQYRNETVSTWDGNYSDGNIYPVDPIYTAKNLYLNCRFINPERIENEGGCVGYKVTVEADSNMLWQEPVTVTADVDRGNNNQNVSRAFSITLDTDMDGFCYPRVSMVTGNNTSLEAWLSNATENVITGVARRAIFVDTPSGCTITMDGEKNYVSGNISLPNPGDNYFNHMKSRNFLRLLPGENSITNVGNVVSTTITYQNRRAFL